LAALLHLKVRIRSIYNAELLNAAKSAVDASLSVFAREHLAPSDRTHYSATLDDNTYYEFFSSLWMCIISYASTYDYVAEYYENIQKGIRQIKRHKHWD